MAKRTDPRKEVPRQPKQLRATRSAPASGTPYIYRVVIEPDDGRYHAEIPTLPGCYSWGRTYEETMQNINEAVELWLEVKKEAGEPIPVEEPETIRNATITVGVLV